MHYFLIFLSVGLSACAQTLFRIGMTRPAIIAALSGSVSVWNAGMTVLFSPYILSGLFAYGLATVLWLLVLSRIPVSLAYPFVALGIVITTLSGIFLLGEQISRLSILGIAVTALGIALVAMGRSA